MRSHLRLSRRFPLGFIAPVIESITGLNALNKIYSQYQATNDPAFFVRQSLEQLNLTYDVQQGDIANIPTTGPLIITANHPFGGVEALVLIDILLKVRSDIRILVNKELAAICELSDIFISVNIIGKHSIKRKNLQALHEAKKWVASGGALLLFPSGEVASWQWKVRRVIEAPWQKSVATLSQGTQAHIVPIFFEGKNSPIFHSLGLIHKRVRTLWLVREIINKRGLKLRVHIGETISPKKTALIQNKRTITNYLRLNTLLLGHQQPATRQKNETNHMVIDTQATSVINAIDPNIMQKEINALNIQDLLLEKNEIQVWCVCSDMIPHVLTEIGRLREITFRAVGEGSGKAVDIDEFDAYYHHLFIWNKVKREIVGAYRIGHVDHILKEKNLSALYSQQLFDYDEAFIAKLSPCLEMGRSFVRKEYQRNVNSLLLLWRGIGMYVANNPHYRVLFGPVSISNNYSEISRQLLASCLTVNNYDKTLAAMINPIKPYKISNNVPWTTEHLSGIKQAELLSSLVKIIEGNKGMPILMKQYLKLQGEFVGFNLDPNFSNALDGLIIVNMFKIEQQQLRKYMGIEPAKRYFDYHAQHTYFQNAEAREEAS